MPEKIQLDLPLALLDARDGRMHRFIDSLASEEGVERVHVVETADGKSAQLCIHYNPYVVPLPRVRQVAEWLDAQLTSQFDHVRWGVVEGIRDRRHARTVAKRLEQMSGVVEAEADVSGPIRIEFDRLGMSEEVLRATLRKMGVRVA